jgi:hypothetical protein
MSVFLKFESFKIADIELKVYQLTGRQGKEIIKKIKELVLEKDKNLDLYELVEPLESILNSCVYFDEKSLSQQGRSILDFSLDDIVLLIEKIIDVNKIFFKTLELRVGFKISLLGEKTSLPSQENQNQEK